MNVFEKFLKILKKEVSSWVSSWSWISMSIVRRTPSRRLRFFMLRSMGAKIGKNVSMFASVDIRRPDRLKLGGVFLLVHMYSSMPEKVYR